MWTLHSEDKTIPYVPGYLILKFFIGLGCALNNIQTPQVFTNINVRYMIFKKKMYKNENGSIEHVKAYIYCIICVNNCICSSQKIILALARIIDCNFTIWHLFHSFFSFSLTFVLVFLQDTGLHYDRYLKEVVMTLEEDPEFRKKLEEANVTDIKVFKNSFLYYFINN